MTKQDFLSRINGLRFIPVGVRAVKDTNYGLDKQTYSVWICGSGSIDPCMVMGVDISFVGRFCSEEKAEKESQKLNKYLNERKVAL